MSHRGQVLLLAVIFLAFSIIYAANRFRKPVPVVAEYRGELQSAELIHAARLYWSNGYTSMDSILSLLTDLAKKHKIYMPNASYENNFTIIGGLTGYGFYSTEYNVSVIFSACWNWRFKGFYFKDLHGEKVLYKSFLLVYYHNYTAPQWGSMVIYPIIEDPAGICDIVRVKDGVWMIGYPAHNDEYTLIDEYGLKLVIRE